MKKLTLIPILICAIIISAFAQEINKKEGTQKKIVIKKIIRNSDSELSDNDIQKLIDSVLQIETPAAGNIQKKIIIDSDGKEHIIMELPDAQTLAPGMSPGDQEEMEFLVTDDEVEHTNKAVLGIEIRDVGGYNGALIEKVLDGSAAGKSGLVKGDIILKVDKVKVTGMSDLIDYLSTKNVGDKVKIQYLRNGVSHKTQSLLQSPAHIQAREMNVPKCCKGISSKSNCEGQKKVVEKRIMRTNDGDDTVIEMKIVGQPKELKEENTGQIKKESTSNLSISMMKSSDKPNEATLDMEFTAEPGPISILILDQNGNQQYTDKIQDFSGKLHKKIVLSSAAKSLKVLIKSGDKILAEAQLMQAEK